MAFIRGWETNEYTSVATVVSGTMPDHQTGDLLLINLVRDGFYASGTWPQTGSWNLLMNANQGTGTTNTLSNVIYYKIASGSDTTFTLTVSSDQYHLATLAIANVNTSSIFNAYQSASSPHGFISGNIDSQITTSLDNCLLVYFAQSDGATGQTNTPGNGAMHLFGQDNGSTGMGSCWKYKERAGPITLQPFYPSTTSTNTEATHMVMAINDDGLKLTPTHVDYTNTPSQLIHPWVGTATPLGGSFPGALSIASVLSNTRIPIVSRSMVFDAPGSTLDYGINPYQPATSITPSITIVTSQLGTQYNFSRSIDLTTGPILFSVLAANPRDIVDMGKTATIGALVTFMSGTTNYVTHHFTGRDATPNPGNRMLACILPNSQSCFGTSSIYPNTTECDRVILSFASPLGATTFYISQMVRLDELIIAGGTTSSRLDINDVFICGTSYPLPYMERQGAAEILSYIPLQFGGGMGAIQLDIDAAAIQFPRLADEIRKELNYHVPPSRVGITFAPLNSGSNIDYIKLTNSVITSPSEYYFKFLTGSIGTIDMSGLTVVNANPIELQQEISLNGVSFSRCGEIYSSGSALGSCTFTSCSVSASLTVSSSTQLNRITGSVFQGNKVGLRLTSPGSYTLNSLTFSNNQYDIENSSTGIITASLTNDSNAQPSKILNSHGGSTLLVNVATLTLTDIVSGSEVRIYSGSNPAEMEQAGQESISDPPGTFAYVYDVGKAGTTVDIVVLALNYEYYRITGYVLGSTDGTLPIQQRFDRSYSNP